MVVSPHYREQVALTSQLRQKAKKFDLKLEKERAAWKLLPAANMTIRLHANGVVLSLPAEAGRVLLHRRLGHILEHDVEIDAVFEGSVERVLEELAVA
jgi:hypothetical protein